MPDVGNGRFTVECGWDDVPHLDERTKKEMYDAAEPHLKEARSQGIPSLGAGAIYPIALREILCDPFIIPDYYPRGYALDVGWKRTASLWGAFDQAAQVLYLTAEYYRGQAEPSIHADAIKARGEWMKGVIDPAARGRNQKDGTRLINDYKEHGLKIEKALNHVEAGLFLCWQLMSAGRIKVFRTLANFQDEFRFYRRDDKGEIVKENDHLMDCMRYMVLSRYSYFTTRPMRAPEMGQGAGVDSRVGY